MSVNGSDTECSLLVPAGVRQLFDRRLVKAGDVVRGDGGHPGGVSHLRLVPQVGNDGLDERLSEARPGRHDPIDRRRIELL